MKEMLKSMQEVLISKTHDQVSNLEEADCRELGEAIDMIKDIEEALYYCTIIEAMEGKNDWERGDGYPVDSKRPYGRMWTSEDGAEHDEHSSSMWRDPREGHSPLSRKQYMETKEMHMDKAKQLRDLEKYMQELTSDIAEMIEDSTPEEKQLLQKKISSLATKIDQLK